MNIKKEKVIKAMIRKSRRIILLGFIAVLIIGGGWNLQFSVQASEELHQRQEVQLQDLLVTPVQEGDGLIELQKLTEIPDQYVELTEAEVAEFPKLKTALQSMISSNKTYIKYDASEREGIRIFSALGLKTQDKYNCSRGCITTFFQYRGELYLFRLSIDDGTPSTSEAPQTTPTVADGLSAFGVLSLLGTGIGIYFARRLNNGQKN